jgi:hypothetical protein
VYRGTGELVTYFVDEKSLQRGKVPAISPTEDDRRTTPWDTVKVHCEVPFTHAINHILTASEDVVVGGRVDHGVELSLDQRKKLIGSFTRSYSASSPNSRALSKLYPNLSCVSHLSVNRASTKDEAIPRSMALRQMVSVTSS